MLEFFKLEPQREFNTAYIMPDRTAFQYQALSRKDIAELNFSINWEVGTDTIVIKTSSRLTFKKTMNILIHAKQYIVESIYTEDLEQDLNSPDFKSKRTYSYIALRY